MSPNRSGPPLRAARCCIGSLPVTDVDQDRYTPVGTHGGGQKTDRLRVWRAPQEKLTERFGAFLDEHVGPAQERYERELLKTGDLHRQPTAMEEPKRMACECGLWSLVYARRRVCREARECRASVFLCLGHGTETEPGTVSPL
jgi:hypothetical protein